MKTPNEIYLNTPKGQTDFNIATWDTKPFDDCENIKYVRKDALLEWAKERLDNVKNNTDDWSKGFICFALELMDKLNEK